MPSTANGSRCRASTSAFILLVYESRALDVVELWERFFQIAVPFDGNAALLGTETARRAFTVPAVQTLDNVESREDGPEGRERLTVEQLRVLRQVDEELRRPGIRSGRRKRQRASLVRLLPRVVGN